MTGDLALLSVNGTLATLTLNRPEARNSLSLELLQALHERVGELERHADVNVLVVTGAGKAFCAGMDLKAVLMEPLPEGGVGEGSSGIRPDVIRPLRQRRSIALSRHLRRTQTVAEAVLWEELRGKKLQGFKFRRQHPFGPFVLDFYCNYAGLAIELDGKGHELASTREDDLARHQWLDAQGVKLIRFTNDAVMHEKPAVLARILEILAVRVGQNPPLPLPQGGVAFHEGSAETQPRGELDKARSLSLRLLTSLAELTLRLRRLPMITLGKVNGAAIGGGCGLACVCDLSVTHADSKMGFPEVDLGVCPAVVAPWLVRKVGAGRARQVLLSGGVMSGQRAFEVGIVNQVVPTAADLDGAADEIVTRLATGGPGAVRATKELLNEIDGSMDDSLVLRGAELSARVLRTPEAQAMLRAKLGGKA